MQFIHQQQSFSSTGTYNEVSEKLQPLQLGKGVFSQSYLDRLNNGVQ